MRIKQMILCALFLSLFAVEFAPSSLASERSQRDSLLAQLKMQYSDTLLLAKLNQITDSLELNINACQYYAAELLKEARHQKNSHYKLRAYLYQIKLAYNSYDIQQVEILLHQIEPLAIKEQQYNDLFFARRCAIDMQLLNQNYEYCEKAGQQLLKDAAAQKNEVGMLEAYQSLANLYSMTYRLELAIDMLEQAQQIALKQKRKGPIVNIHQTLILLYQEVGDNTKWIRTLNTYRSYLQTQPEGPETHSINLILYSSYLCYYTIQEEWTQAEKFRKLAENSYPYINSPLYKIRYNRACVSYYQHRELYDLALEQMEILLEQVKAVTTGLEYHNDLVLKAYLLYKTGSPEEAIPIYKKVTHFNDSLQVATVNKQYEQLKKDFNADQLLFEQAQLKHRIQLYTLFLLTAGLLIMGYFLRHLQRSRRILQKAEREMREMNQQMEQANQAKDRFLSNISTSIRTPLNAVVEGSLKLAEGQVKDEQERQSLSTEIPRKARLLLKMINDILDLSRLEAGMMKFEVTEVEITSMMLDAISSSAAFGNEIEIRADFAMDTLYMTDSDGNRLSQVFKSFFDDKASNAERIVVRINYTQPSTLVIEITGSSLSETAPAQEIIIRNEINRMLIELFGGVYQFTDHEKTQDTIHFTIAIKEVIQA